MSAEQEKRLAKRFRLQVLLPGGLILMATAAFLAVALQFAGRSTDDLSLLAQQSEVWRASGQGLDELALAQEAVATCDRCLFEARSDNPDREWLDERVGEPLRDLYHVHESYILGADGTARYAFLDGSAPPGQSFASVSEYVEPLVALALGETRRVFGRSNMNERLPGSPPAPLEIPPMPGFTDEPTTVYPSVRTSSRVLHATDMVRIGDRIALASAMQLRRFDGADDAMAGRPPVLVSIRYLDDQFLGHIAQQNYLTDARISDSPEAREGEVSAVIMNSESVPLGNIFWKPVLGGGVVVDDLMLPAAVGFGVVALLLFVMALYMRKLMRSDDEHLSELQRTHLELKAKEAQAFHLAYHDVLTGLPNRALFNDHVDTTLLRSRHGEEMALLLLDLDGFKHVNDRFGHLVGDQLIVEVGKRLDEALVEHNAVARLGGDEFAVLLEGRDLAEGVEAKIASLTDALQQPYELLGNQAHVGVSIGVALAPECGVERTELMRKADIALYRAKEEGRNCFRFFTQSMDETVQRRATIEADLRKALESGTQLCVHYQPLVNADGELIEGFEALLRWEHSSMGWLSPEHFVKVAEETGLISELGDFVIEDACSVAKQFPGCTVAINLSPVQFCDDQFAGRICDIVHSAGVDPGQIELEVTESIMLDKNELVRGAIKRLRQEGFRIALDDFGTGYSSLSYLRDFEIDRIKIDKSFVHGLDDGMEAGAITTAVITLGHAMGLEITAEGVETTDQQDFLRSAGCNLLQGYLFSKAVPASELADAIDGRKTVAAA